MRAALANASRGNRQISPAVVDPLLIEKLTEILQAAPSEWTALHLGAADVRERGPRANHGREELLATIRPQHWKYLRPDNGDLPDGCAQDHTT